MVINSPALSLWVERADKKGPKRWVLDGFGLGNESGVQNEDVGYSGMGYFISAKETFCEEVDISWAHIQRRGFRWLLDTQRLPERPFYLTSEEGMKLTFTGQIMIQPSVDSELVFSRDGSIPSYGVYGPGWLGVLKFVDSSSRCRLQGFSADGFSPKCGSHIMFSDWDCAVGRLLLVSG